MKYIKSHPTKYTHALIIFDWLLTISILAAIVVDFFAVPILNFLVYACGVVILIITTTLLIRVYTFWCWRFFSNSEV